MKVDRYEPGVPCWVDLGTPDIDKSLAYYTQLFGWTVDDQGEEAGHYHIASAAGLPVAGIGPLMSPGPARWTNYVSVTSADDTVAKVEGAGGTVLMGPMDVMDVGRMAIVADPAGAAIGIWQPGNFQGAQLVNEPGAFVWSQLMSTDIDRATSFYTEVFGWEASEDTENGGTAFSVAGKPVSGGMAMPSEVPAGTPSYWDVYFSVADADETAARVKELGGQILMGPQDIAAGRIAATMDPTGAMVGIAATTP